MRQAVALGIAVSRIARIRFGMDSLVERLSRVVSFRRPGLYGADQRREGITTKLVDMTLSCASLIKIPLPAPAKRAGSPYVYRGPLESDSRPTVLCAYISATRLGGPAFSALPGWLWDDPVGGPITLPLIPREGIKTLRRHMRSA